MSPLRGMSMIDVIVGTALFLVVFLGLFGILRASLQVSGLAKLKAAATEVATSQMEYLRSLEYDDVGTVGGIPSGLVPQNATTTNAGVSYAVRTYVAYVDDPADGLGGADATGITTDYKVAKVTVTYSAGTIEREVVMMTNIAPNGIESTTGGGTLQINVVDAVGTPVSGATVHIENTATDPAVDLTTFSDVSGRVLLPGAPTSTEYQVEVSKSGYSTSTTYARDAANVNPAPGYLTVVEDTTTTGTFAIDLLATLTIRTFSPIAPAVTRDEFDDASGLASISNTVTSGGALVLSGAPGSYPGSGTALSDPFAPAYLASWVSASSTIIEGPQVSARISVADGAGNILPDAVVPGNSAGFTGLIDLSLVSTTTYPSLSLLATLTSTDVNATPSVLMWEIGYTAGPTPFGDVDFTLSGAKTIGSDGGGAPIYKTSISSTTNSAGVYSGSLEWDSYDISIPSYTTSYATPTPPYELLPGTDVEGILILTP